MTEKKPEHNERSKNEEKLEHQKWIEKADKDLHDAEISLQQKLYEVAAFLSHQAAEKALKSAYMLKYNKLWKIHNLYDLGKKLDAPEKILDLGEKLNQHYLATRYPVDEEYTEERAEEALEYSKEVLKWAKEKITKLQK